MQSPNPKNDKLLNLRPIIDVEFNENKSKVEQFMHETLRPILKFQNEKIQVLIESEAHFNKNEILTKGETEGRDYLKNFISKNPSLKFQLIGCIVGLMTSVELEFYTKNRTDLSKRISEMIVTRYHSNYIE